MPTYSVYGVIVRSTFTFRSPLPLSALPPTLHIVEAESLTAVGGAMARLPIPEEHWNPATPRAIHRFPGEDVLEFPGGDQVRVQPTRITYCYAGPRASYPDMVDVRLLGVVFAWWVLTQGRIPLHAGALVVDGGAVLFSAESGMGKSSLMASLVARGVPLLCDDFVTLHLAPNGQVMAASAYPQMRLWPNSVEQFVGLAADHPPVVEGGTKRRVRVGGKWGRFLEGTLPVSRIYLLHRRESVEGPIESHAVAGHAAFMQILAAITMGTIFPVTDFETVWSVAQSFAAQVPVYQLSYPSGWHWLPLVQQAVLDPRKEPVSP